MTFGINKKIPTIYIWTLFEKHLNTPEAVILIS